MTRFANDGKRCRATTGYRKRCRNRACGGICEGQMAGFCGMHLNMSFTLARILHSIAKKLVKHGHRALAQEILRDHKVNISLEKNP